MPYGRQYVRRLFGEFGLWDGNADLQSDDVHLPRGLPQQHELYGHDSGVRHYNGQLRWMPRRLGLLGDHTHVRHRRPSLRPVHSYCGDRPRPNGRGRFRMSDRHDLPRQRNVHVGTPIARAARADKAVLGGAHAPDKP